LSAAFKSSDYSFANYKPALFTEIHVTFSVVTACIPFLIPVMNSLQTGVLAGDLRTLPGPSSRNYHLSMIGKNSVGSHSSQAWIKPKDNNNVMITAGRHGSTPNEENQAGGDASESQIIVKQTTMTVQYHDKCSST
jgi:hypothetical protein